MCRSLKLTAILLLLTLILISPALGVPQMPHAFYGTVTVSGKKVPDGTVVAAFIGGVEYARTTVTDGKYGYSPTFKVPADDPDTPEKEGGTSGETIVFYVIGLSGGKYKVATYEFEIGGVTNLDLKVTDNVDPEISVKPVKSPTSKSSITLSGTFKEDFLEKIEVLREGEVIATASFDRKKGTWSATVSLVEGSNELTIRAIDMSGNIGTTTITVTYQKAAPAPAPGPTPTPPEAPSNVRCVSSPNDNTPVFAWDPPKAEAGIKGYYVRIDNGEAKWIGNVTTWECTSPVKDGNHTFYVRAEDNQGNKGEWASCWFYVDTTPPVIDILTPLQGVVLGTGLHKVNGTAYDVGLGIERVEVFVGEKRLDVTTTVEDGTVSWEALWAAEEDGRYTITVRAVDKAGNTEEESTWVEADTTPPSLTITSPKVEVTNERTIEVSGTFDEPHLQSILVNGLPATIEGNKWRASVTLEEGSNRINVTAIDSASPPNKRTLIIEITLDTEAPTITDFSPTEKIEETRPTIRASYSDNIGIDTAKVTILLDGTNITSAATVTSDAVAYTPTEDLEPGDHTVTVRVYDLAGNKAERSWTFTIERPVNYLPYIIAGVVVVVVVIVAVLALRRRRP